MPRECIDSVLEYTVGGLDSISGICGNCHGPGS